MGDKYGLHINWNKYIEYGWFTSTNDVELPFKFEFDKLEEEQRDKEIITGILYGISLIYDIVGIHTIHPKEVESLCSFKYHPEMRNCEYVPFKSIRGFIIYDDVITTGKTISECIRVLGAKPEFCICLIDRRREVSEEYTEYKPEVDSLYSLLNNFD